jgi:ubiquinone/menaquinone biosynthesis C-methylase UbiE
MNQKAMKLENPARLAELSPAATLIKIGLKDGQVLCDIGAGSGIFTIPAARLTRGTVYAVEVSEAMLSVIGEKVKSEGLKNVELVLAEGTHYPIESHSADVALVVAVLHEIPEKAAFAEEVRRLLKPGGIVAVIEFHKRETLMGPPFTLRLGQDETAAVFEDAGFRRHDSFDLGDNLYCMVFESSGLPVKTV